jgi:citrate lyase subunit beta/citryl-CoA lyase
MDTPHLQEDLAVVMAGQPDIILLPKLENGEQLLQLSALLDSLEAKNNIPAKSTKVIAITGETPTGVLGFDSIDNPCDRLVGLSWGPEDLATELGATANRDGEGKFLPPFELLRTLCLLKAKQLGVQAIDTVFTGIGNSEGLSAECIAAHSIGYTGKLAIHPSQVELINQAFSPTEEELIRAKKIVDLFAANPNAGALQLDNKMVDIPHLKQAQRLLARSDNSG